MHATHDELVLHYYGESGDDRARLDLHLAICAECQGAMQRLQRALALVDANDEGEPGPGYEATMWARLQDHLVQSRGSGWWRQLWPASAGRLAIASGMAAVATVAFYAGWQARDVTSAPGPTDRPAAAATHDAAIEPVRARLLDLAVRDHLDRAQLVLADVTNAGDDVATLDGDRQRAMDLVATNRLVRQSATLGGDDSLDAVLEDLERVLIDIANAPDDLTAEDWAAFKARIETQSLLFRVRVLADDARARQRPPTTPRKGTTS